MGASTLMISIEVETVINLLHSFIRCSFNVHLMNERHWLKITGNTQKLPCHFDNWDAPLS